MSAGGSRSQTASASAPVLTGCPPARASRAMSPRSRAPATGTAAPSSSWTSSSPRIAIRTALLCPCRTASAASAASCCYQEWRRCTRRVRGGIAGSCCYHDTEWACRRKSIDSPLDEDRLANALAVTGTITPVTARPFSPVCRFLLLSMEEIGRSVMLARGRVEPGASCRGHRDGWRPARTAGHWGGWRRHGPVRDYGVVEFDLGFSAESRVIHGGTSREQGAPVGPPLLPTSVYVSAGEPDPDRGYGRMSNPGWDDVEAGLAALEGPGAIAVSFASGQAASMALMLSLAQGRERIVFPTDGYYNTRALAAKLRPHGAAAAAVDLLDLAAVGEALAAGPAVLWAETPTNPLLRVADLEALASLALTASAPLVVDNTVATGLLQRPLEFGAVASVYSLTKSLSGHSDAADRARVIERARHRGLPRRPSAGDRRALPGPVAVRRRGQADAARLRPAALLRDRGVGGRRRRRGCRGAADRSRH
ncbi:hypothetical protein EAS64_22375 [Trebonia kvetii]|uniref:PLP-dependent transferase n=1 Tax=Trebonia kvetii TaxID=2480626 RepID=A0A6P2BW73_9ACTN|nr:hypothetical protein EAS64_22375 [Trebonia kvetii]